LTNTFQTAGILSIIKGALVLQKKTIHAQTGVTKKLGHCPSLENGQIVDPANITTFSGQTVGQGKKRRIIVNSSDAAERRVIY
jgi:hypothetical protein